MSLPVTNIHIHDEWVGYRPTHLKRVENGYTHLWIGYGEDITLLARYLITCLGDEAPPQLSRR